MSRRSGVLTGTSRSIADDTTNTGPLAPRRRAGRLFSKCTERWDARGAVNAPPLASQVRFLSGAHALRRRRPNGPGSGLLSRTELVRLRPAARTTRVPSFAGEAPGSYPDERGSIPRGLTTRKEERHGTVFQLRRPVSPGDGPLSPAGRAGVWTVREELLRLVEGTHETSLGRPRLLRRGRDQHPRGPGSPGLRFISARWLDGKRRRPELRPMAGPRSYKPPTGVRFPQLRPTPRAAARSVISFDSRSRRLWREARLGAPRAAHFVRGVRISSPIEGREPAFEAGDVGSIPARGTVRWPWCTGVHASL